MDSAELTKLVIEFGGQVLVLPYDEARRRGAKGFLTGNFGGDREEERSAETIEARRGRPQ